MHEPDFPHPGWTLAIVGGICLGAYFGTIGLIFLLSAVVGR